MARSKFLWFLFVLTLLFAVLSGGAIAYLEMMGDRQASAVQAADEPIETPAAAAAAPAVPDGTEAAEPPGDDTAAEETPAVAETAKPAEVVKPAASSTTAAGPEPAPAPEPEPAAQPEAGAAQPDAFYWVLLGTEDSQAAADALSSQLQELEITTEVVEEGGSFEVLTGPYADFSAGQADADRMSQIAFLTDEVGVKIMLNR